MKKTVVDLIKSQTIDLIHCRSYVAAMVAMEVKKEQGIPWLFDMRGFWVDERAEGGVWNQNKWLFRKLYQHYKKKEQALFASANAIISLTKAGAQTIKTWPAWQQAKAPISIIPCCVDFEQFDFNLRLKPSELKAQLGMDPEDWLLSYHGSLGTWYSLDKLCNFYLAVQEQYPKTKLLFLTKTDPRWLHQRVSELGLQADQWFLKSVEPAQVAEVLAGTDLNLFFYKSGFSRQATSPVKLAEAMALGLPVLTQDGVGDVKEIIESFKGGLVLEDFSENAIQSAVAALPKIIASDPKAISKAAFAYYDLQGGIEGYHSVYQSIVHA